MFEYIAISFKMKQQCQQEYYLRKVQFFFGYQKSLYIQFNMYLIVCLQLQGLHTGKIIFFKNTRVILALHDKFVRSSNKLVLMYKPLQLKGMQNDMNDKKKLKYYL